MFFQGPTRKALKNRHFYSNYNCHRHDIRVLQLQRDQSWLRWSPQWVLRLNHVHLGGRVFVILAEEHSATHSCFSQMEMPFIVACSVAIEGHGPANPAGSDNQHKGVVRWAGLTSIMWVRPRGREDEWGQGEEVWAEVRVCVCVCHCRRKQWGVSARNFFALIPIPHPYPHHTHTLMSTHTSAETHTHDGVEGLHLSFSLLSYGP